MLGRWSVPPPSQNYAGRSSELAEIYYDFEIGSAQLRCGAGSLLVQSLLAEERPLPHPRRSTDDGWGALSSAAGGGLDGGRRRRQPTTSVVTEIKDRKSLQLLRVAGVSNNFVIANELSRNPGGRQFWLEHIFSSEEEANNLSIVRVGDFIDQQTRGATPITAWTLWDVLTACRAKGATPIAFRRYGGEENKWAFNPREKATALGLRDDDFMLILARFELHGQY
jgi:hypothetical protein